MLWQIFLWICVSRIKNILTQIHRNHSHSRGFMVRLFLFSFGLHCCFITMEQSTAILCSKVCISLIESDDENEITTAQKALEKIFVALMKRGDLFIREPSDDSSSSKDAERTYKRWLQDCYSDTKKQLLENLQHTSTDVKNNSFNVLMKLIQAETSFPLKSIPSGSSFPINDFKKVIENILLQPNNEHLITQLKESLQYTDITFFLLKSLVLILKKRRKKKKGNNLLLVNTFALLSKVSIPKPKQKGSNDIIKANNFTNCSDCEELSSANYRYMRKLFSSAWTTFLSFKLPTKLYKKVLVILDEDILPYFSKPLLLTDFLTKSYKIGGAVSLLALSGIYALMRDYNLEYPDFYKKFYALVQPSVFHSQHKARFFFLADLFLSSTHVPEYMVAAFIKRLSRLSLSAPPAALLVIIPFICNLLIRHPQLKVLINRTNCDEVTEDPYLLQEEDPAKCQALESSLWEIKTLQSHWFGDVAVKAKFIEKSLPKMESDLSDLYRLDSHQLFQKELTRNYPEVPLNYEKPAGLFERNEDVMKDIWIVQ